jgi:uncharacterized membrane-anchored protein YhcB (DUF1043 family)
MMTPEQMTSMITAIGTVITAIGIVVNNIMAKINAHKSAERSKVTQAKIEEVHKATNGMKTELVDEVRKSATEAGNKAGRVEEQIENPRT